MNPPTTDAARAPDSRGHILMLSPDSHMIDRRILQQARSLRDAGYRVTLLSGAECAQEEHTCRDGIEIHRYRYDWDDERLKRIRARLPRSERLQRWTNLLFMKILRRFLRRSSLDVFVLARARELRADFVHVHDLPFLPYGVALAAEWEVPLVFDAHEIYHQQETLAPRQRAALARIERRCLPRVDLFITVNPAIAGWYEKQYGVRPLVLLNCAETLPAESVGQGRRVLRSRAGLPEAARIVLYQGWISGERNIETLVRAARHFPADTWLVIIGYGEFEDTLKEILRGQEWEDRVRFLGRAEPEEILGLTAGADLGVIPYQPIDLNHRLCSPNKFFEYVQTGVPVVAHDLPFFREMASLHGVVETGDLATPEGMGSAIRGLLDDPDRLATLRAACARAARTLNWETESGKLIEAYSRLGG